MQWYYISEAKRRLPFQESDVPSLVDGRVLRPETMVWKKGMGDWISVSELQPEWFTASDGGGARSAEGEAVFVRDIAGTFADRRIWIALAGGLFVAIGTLLLLLFFISILQANAKGVVAGILAFVPAVSIAVSGVYLIGASTAGARAAETGQRSLLHSAQALVGLASRMFVLGVLAGAVVAGVWAAVSLGVWGRFLGPFEV